MILHHGLVQHAHIRPQNKEFCLNKLPQLNTRARACVRACVCVCVYNAGSL
jgi:hypothetical protein